MTAIDEYVIHGFPGSLFTRKLEAALRFYGAPFRTEPKGTRDGSELEARAQTHQIPILVTPENWALADTTPILALLDARFPARRLFPTGPLGVLVHIAEEVLDEWFARVMVHYRWHYAENTRDVIQLILGKTLSLEEAQEHPLAQWGPRACRATGTELPEHQAAAEQEYLGMLAGLEAQLGHTRYALGDRPTAADCILLGGLRAHINRDPTPDLEAFPKSVAWDEQDADRWDGSGELAAFPESTPFAAHLLAIGRDHYAPFVLGNARALSQGDKSFVIDTYGTPCSYLTRPYPEQSRRMVQARIRDQQSSSEQEAVRVWLKEVGLAECFLP